MSTFDVLTRGDVLGAAMQARDYLVSSGVPAALAGKDPRMWGGEPRDLGRLGWLDLPYASQELLRQIGVLAAEARRAGLDHVALIATGADGLAARAIAAAGGRADALTLLDGMDPAALDRALARLDRTLVVLASKAGVSIEGDAYRRILAGAFRKRGLPDQQIRERFLVITDHETPLHGFARRSGYRLGLTDPYLPGHFGALSAYGVVPAALAGANVGGLLADAAAALPSLGGTQDNPGLLLGAALGGCAQQRPGGPVRDKVALSLAGPGGPVDGTLGDWVAQLLATGTGRRGRGILPLPAEGHPGADLCPDVHTVALHQTGPRAAPPQAGPDLNQADTTVWGALGAQFLLWEYATATAGWLLGVNPFEDGTALAQEAEDDAAAMLRQGGGRPPAGEPDFTDQGVEVYGDAAAARAYGRDLRRSLEALLLSIPGTGYLTIMTYLSGDFSGRFLAPPLARHAGRPVAFGPGPGLLHGTGPYHMDGPRTGAFLVVTGEPETDLPVPGRPYTLGGLRLARAVADMRALRRRGLPVLRVHLRDPAEGAARLLEAARQPLARGMPQKRR